MRRTLAVSIGVLLLCCSSGAPAQESASHAAAAEPEIRQFLAGFMAAFDNLDWEKFRAAFFDDATVFYPRGRANRADGRTEVEAYFTTVFEQIRAGRIHAPYMDLRPRDLRIKILRSGDTAVVTFHLDDRQGFVNRRTLILEKSPGGWKIVHLHASEVAI